MTRLRGYQPLVVGGYGLVVNLNGQGSSEVPAYLRRWLINEMRKKGVGSAALGTSGMSPERVLASSHTAVVAVQGLIPPGATKGARFDVLVSCLPQTQTTSLEGGRLWTTDLSTNGTDPSMRFSHRLAAASGPMYINPLNQKKTLSQSKLKLRRQAVVLSGGVATADRDLALILHQPSWQRSRLIADRINERFPKSPTDRRDTAVPIDDTHIKLNIPSRYARRADRLLELISHAFIQRSPGFEQAKAKQLATLLLDHAQYAQGIAMAWIAMGKTVLPVVRPYYNHPDQVIRLAALEAGARMEDELVAESFEQISRQSDPQLRRQIAQMLGYLPRSLRGAKTLQQLLDDPDTTVRIQAYESLAKISDPIIQRMAIDGPGADRFKFVLDLVPSQTPLIYVAQSRLPRLVIFNPTLGFQAPFLAKIWDNRLMLRASEPDQTMTVFYQKPGDVEGQTLTIRPTVADLTYLMGHRPSIQNPRDGLDLDYSQVVNAVFQLCDQGAIPVDTHLQINPLAQAIARAEQAGDHLRRPESDPANAADRSEDRGTTALSDRLTPDPEAERRPGIRVVPPSESQKR